MKVPSRGCAAPLTKEEQAENQAEMVKATPAGPMKNDLNALVKGDLSQKTTAALNLAGLAAMFVGSEPVAANVAVRDMSWGMVPRGHYISKQVGLSRKAKLLRRIICVLWEIKLN